MNEDGINYISFLKKKVVIAENYGIETKMLDFSKSLFPHQKDIAEWALKGGRRAIFASFGLGKTFMQLEIATQLIKKYNKPFLIGMPLGVSGEFKRDAKKLGIEYDVEYIIDTDTFKNEVKIYVTNYERIRMGDIDPMMFCGVSFDEASILRNLQTETTNYILSHFKDLQYRFIATSTPTPNDYIEILNYADYLGVISRGHALTRFFQRDSTKAGHLTLYENKKKEFWQWVSTWAAFLSSPKDLGYDDTGYNLPKLNIIEHCVTYDLKNAPLNKFGVPMMFKDTTKSLLEVSREKRDSMLVRLNKAVEIAKDLDNAIIWHHLEDERDYLERSLDDYISVYGSLPAKIKEKRLIDFSENKAKYLLTKPKIAGSGCNFQNSNNMIFAGIDYKFNDFIQAVHRQYRFGQTKEVNVHIIYTENEAHVIKTLYRKWKQHEELQQEMIELVKEYGLNQDVIRSQMERQMFDKGKKVVYDNVTLINNDCVIAIKDFADNSIDMGLTSIPFGDHYEYSDNYNDFGHNHGNENFFKQMDYLTPELLRVLKPGRIFAVHVKDRIRYSYQNGTSFTTISDFSGDTARHFTQHGFYLIGKITVTTDVVAENNQTYRLGWTEQCKDGTKMGVGLPEYVLLFRKAPTLMNNAYSDSPVVKSKSDYTKARWQLDAHAYWRSSGDRLMTLEEISELEPKFIYRLWEKKNTSEIYNFISHLKLCEELDKKGKLSSTFMSLPVHSNNEMVWTNVNRMKTLNANQVSNKKEKHICPLQFDIIERLIDRYSMQGETILDPFGGLFSTAYKALEMGRKAVSIELNSEYFNDGHFYIKSMLEKLNAPTLFDLIGA